MCTQVGFNCTSTWVCIPVGYLTTHLPECVYQLVIWQLIYPSVYTSWFSTTCLPKCVHRWVLTVHLPVHLHLTSWLSDNSSTWVCIPVGYLTTHLPECVYQLVIWQLIYPSVYTSWFSTTCLPKCVHRWVLTVHLPVHLHLTSWLSDNSSTWVCIPVGYLTTHLPECVYQLVIWQLIYPSVYTSWYLIDISTWVCIPVGYLTTHLPECVHRWVLTVHLPEYVYQLVIRSLIYPSVYTSELFVHTSTQVCTPVGFWPHLPKWVVTVHLPECVYQLVIWSHIYPSVYTSGVLTTSTQVGFNCTSTWMCVPVGYLTAHILPQCVWHK